jgi:phage terminase large subunit
MAICAWFSEVLPVNVTGAMSEAAVEQQRIEYTGIFGKEAADALIDQEYYCSFEAAILGAYWGKEMLLAVQQGRITDVPVTPDLPVHTAWDIGVDDAMAIWCFQVYFDHIDVVDYYEGHGQGTDWMPHDAKFREAGAPGARTRIETLVTLGRWPPSSGDGRHQRRPQDHSAGPVRRRALRPGPRDAAILSRRMGREGARVQEDARAQLGLSWRGCVWRYLSLSWRAPMCEPGLLISKAIIVPPLCVAVPRQRRSVRG